MTRLRLLCYAYEVHNRTFGSGLDTPKLGKDIFHDGKGANC